MNQLLIFLDGKIIKANRSLIENLSPGVVTGQGVFETMRSYRGQVFALDRHLIRLYRGLKVCEIKISYSKKELSKFIDQVLASNRLKEARVRLSVWHDQDKQHVAIVCQNLSLQKRNIYRQGFLVKTYSKKINPEKLINIKSIRYDPFLKAGLEAKQKGCDESVLIDSKGRVIEGARTNIFFVKDNVLYTPALSVKCLNGITRRLVIECAKKLMIPIKEVGVQLADLYSADEVFLTNSILEIMPASVLEGHRINQGIVGPLTKRLQKTYQQLVKKSLSK